MEKHPFQVRLTPHQRKRLRAAAHEHGVSMSELARVAIAEKLNNLVYGGQPEPPPSVRRGPPSALDVVRWADSPDF